MNKPYPAMILLWLTGVGFGICFGHISWTDSEVMNVGKCEMRTTHDGDSATVVFPDVTKCSVLVKELKESD